MITLDDSLLIGRGASRATYRHPDRQDTCIKIPVASEKFYRQVLAPWRRLPLPCANERELKGYREVLSSMSNPPSYLSQVHGPVETTLGRGLLVENVNPFGLPVFSLREIRDAGMLPYDARLSQIASQVEEMIEDCRKHNVRNHCMALESILFVKEGDGYRMRLVDYKTVLSHSISPVSSKRLWRWRSHATGRLRKLLTMLKDSQQPAMPVVHIASTPAVSARYLEPRAA